MRDLSYPVVVRAAKTWFRLGAVNIEMTGVDHIPSEGGALLAINHLSFVDYVMAGYPGVQRGRLTRFIAKQELFDHPVGGPVMRSFHHIALDRGSGRAGMEKAVEYLRSGELVGIFPEGTISRSFELTELKSGAARIAAQARVPLIPVTLFGTQRFLTKGRRLDLRRHKTVLVEVGEPLHPAPDSDAGVVTAELEARMREQLDRLIRAYPAEESPAGAWWIPQRFGGSAPTPDEAAAMYIEERRRRAERRAAQRAKRRRS